MSRAGAWRGGTHLPPSSNRQPQNLPCPLFPLLGQRCFLSNILAFWGSGHRDSSRSRGALPLSRIASLMHNSEDGDAVAFDEKVDRVWKMARHGTAHTALHDGMLCRIVSDGCDRSCKILCETVGYRHRFLAVPIASRKRIGVRVRSKEKAIGRHLRKRSSRTLSQDLPLSRSLSYSRRD